MCIREVCTCVCVRMCTCMCAYLCVCVCVRVCVHMKLTLMANFTCRYFRDESATKLNICKESASGKTTVLSSNRHIIRVCCIVYSVCVNGNVYDFTYLYRYIATCTCIRAWLLHALSKQSCKAVVRERAYSDSICTIDVTPWGLASLACVLRDPWIGSSTQIDQTFIAHAQYVDFSK